MVLLRQPLCLTMIRNMQTSRYNLYLDDESPDFPFPVDVLPGLVIFSRIPVSALIFSIL